MKFEKFVTKLKPDIETHKSLVSLKERSKTDLIVVHCSATQPKDSFDWKSIDQMHRQRGFITIGYHFVIKTDGTIQEGRPLNAIGAHAQGYNDRSVGICLIGGVDSKGKAKDNFTDEQRESLKKLLDWLWFVYPESNIMGHRDLPNVSKDCPCFDLDKVYHPPVMVPYGGMETLKEYNLSMMDLLELNFGETPNNLDMVRVK